MEANNDPVIFVEGIDEIIRRDLVKHTDMLASRKLDLQSWQEGVSHHVRMKRHYVKQIGGGKFNDDALRKSVDQINLNITHLQQKVKLAKEAIEHETLIVDTLTEQLEDYEVNARAFADRCRQQASPDN